MEEFYSLLRSYNKTFDSENLPQWTKIYLEPSPPVYWTILSHLLNNYSNEKAIFEIGSGTGDILALIRGKGFINVFGIESDKQLADIANKKIEYFFQIPKTVINDKYPITITKPDILIQVNCVFFENICNKYEYLELLKTYYQNAKPDIYFLEVIDSTYAESTATFPEYVRLSEKDIQNTFQNKRIESQLTYQFPKNTSSKRLYVIS